MRSTQLYAPDGMMRGSAPLGAEAERFAGNTWHDDGLVHNHNWAVGATMPARHPRPAGGGYFGAVAMRVPASTEAARFHDEAVGHAVAEDDHDDGLVHNHDWAVSAK